MRTSAAWENLSRDRLGAVTIRHAAKFLRTGPLPYEVLPTIPSSRAARLFPYDYQRLPQYGLEFRGIPPEVSLTMMVGTKRDHVVHRVRSLARQANDVMRLHISASVC